ncbi:class I SAM-dependent methyltransferase [Dactylosporangium sp. NPDC049742]|uniref:class I SAM-dependent methyltransferase n=1 Tax=Dactylosporangium sp. NPDC049742 TaxID=3154737 RepID=UPI0034455D00
MTPYVADPGAWQESWDLQQSAFMPDREHRIAAMIDAVEAVTEDPPRVLDLAGGTGSIALRVLRRLPGAQVTLLDVDPVLLCIARASLRDRAQIVTADLRDPAWTGALPHAGYDAVLAATALHWLPAERLRVLYAELRTVLRPGGLLVNADHMPDPQLPGLTKQLVASADARRDARYAAGAAPTWSAWWDLAAADPVLGPLTADRAVIHPKGASAEFLPPVSWHLDALRDAGFTESGTLWRGGPDAAVAAVR